MPKAPEQQAREKIDAQLAECGWLVQDYRNADFSAGRGIALREVRLSTGPCDYLLFVDRQPVGVIEAKKEGTTLSAVADQSASLVGLTATPAPQTIAYFQQNRVAEYTHERAVADGVNVGYDLYRIRTKVTATGGKIEKGFYIDHCSKVLQFLEEGALDENLFREIIARHDLVDAWAKFERQFLSGTP